MVIVYPHINYENLFAAIANDDNAAFKTLFDLCKTKMYALAFKWTKSSFAAEEITQEIFVALWISRVKLISVLDPEAYLYTIAYNKISSYLKKENNQQKIIKQWQQKVCSNETEETVLAHNTEACINNAVEQLSPQKKLIYQLSRNYGKSYAEIGAALHLSPHTVKSHLMKALRFIRSYIKENTLLLVLFIKMFL